MSQLDKIHKIVALAESLAGGESPLPVLLGALTIALGRSGDPLFNADVAIGSIERARTAIERVLSGEDAPS